MKYTFNVPIDVSIESGSFSKRFPGTDPCSADAEKVVSEFAEGVVEAFLNGKLIPVEESEAQVAKARSEAWQDAIACADDFRFRPGKGGC